MMDRYYKMRVLDRSMQQMYKYEEDNILDHNILQAYVYRKKSTVVDLLELLPQLNLPSAHLR